MSAVAAWRGRGTTDPPALAEPSASGEWWILGGVAAGLAGRLAVPVGYVRGLLFAGSLVQPAVIYAYLLAALALPHEGRRPDWVNLIGFARVATAFGLVWSVGAGGVGIAMFDQGPGVWVTQGGVCLAGLLALLATGAPAAERDRARDRRSVLAALPLVGGAGLVALGVVLVPGVRWERVLAGVALAGGLAAMVGVGRGGSRSVIAPAGTIALATVVLALAGTRLDGGVGNRRVVAPASPASRLTYRRAIGDLTIDLRSLGGRAGTVTVTASVGIGTLTVQVPSEAQVSGVERVGRGSLGPAPGAPKDGYGLRRAFVAGAIDPGSGRPLARPRIRVRVEATVGIGHVEIARADPMESGPL